jgi:hypothetical protein
VPGHQAPHDLIYPDLVTPNKSLSLLARPYAAAPRINFCIAVEFNAAAVGIFGLHHYFFYATFLYIFVKRTKLEEIISQIKNNVGPSYSKAPFGAHIYEHNTNAQCALGMQCVLGENLEPTPREKSAMLKSQANQAPCKKNSTNESNQLWQPSLAERIYKKRN